MTENNGTPFVALLNGTLLNEKELSRFMAKLKVFDRGYFTPCWEWQNRIVSGYGAVKIRRLNVADLYAHRVSLAQATGFDLKSPLFACHHCDNPPCCNPDHLYPGTAKQNTNDMIMRGRRAVVSQSGEENGNCKLTKCQVVHIATMLSTMNNKQIAATIGGITHSTISLIRRGKQWSDVTGIKEGDYNRYSSMK